MRQETAGGWANVSVWKVICLSILNALGIRFLNYTKVIQFNLSAAFRNGTETLSYSFNLNSSYHPRMPYQTDIPSLKHRSLVIIGSEDEANDPLQYPDVMQDSQSESIQVIPGVKHLDIVHSLAAFNAIAHWIETHG